MTLLANLGVHMAQLLFFFPGFDAFHMSQGLEFCIVQPLLVYEDFF